MMEEREGTCMLKRGIVIDTVERQTEVTYPIGTKKKQVETSRINKRVNN